MWLIGDEDEYNDKLHSHYLFNLINKKVHKKIEVVEGGGYDMVLREET